MCVEKGVQRERDTRQGLGLRTWEGALEGVVRSLAFILNYSVRLTENLGRKVRCSYLKRHSGYSVAETSG